MAMRQFKTPNSQTHAITYVHGIQRAVAHLQSVLQKRQIKARMHGASHFLQSKTPKVASVACSVTFKSCQGSSQSFETCCYEGPAQLRQLTVSWVPVER